MSQTPTAVPQRSPQASGAPAIVRQHFAVAADGSFDLEAATFVVRAA